jgi:hypothetical protein
MITSLCDHVKFFNGLLGRGWKVSPSAKIQPDQTFTVADIASVAYWYQTLPTVPFPALPSKDQLELI